MRRKRPKEPLAQLWRMLRRGHKIAVMAPRLAEGNVDVEAFGHANIILEKFVDLRKQDGGRRMEQN